MNQLRKFLQSLSIKQRLSLGLAAVAVIGGILAFTRWNHQRDFKPLYASLSSEDASSVIAKLKEGGVEYRFSESDSSILVPSGRVPELRLQMAAAGIPKSGRIGFELFDRTNLGTTDFAEQVNYHRAIEGELERSVMAMSEVEQARVHITFPKDSVFTENRQPAKASVMVKLKLGAKLSTQNAQAITQLVSSAVETLAPESVSVMDMQGNLLIRPKKPGDGSEPSDELLSWKKQLETETLAKITSVLDPLLGSDKYRASVDLDCDQTSGEQSEETFDPTHSVLTTSQRSEEGSINRESGGVPGTQSNLPRPVPRVAGTGGGLARRSESMNYETSRLVRRLKLPQGIVRRMSVSVIVDHNVRWESANGKSAAPKKIVEPPSPDTMKVIHDVVAAAAGFNANRGDQLTVNSLPFEATLQAGPPPSLSAPATPPTGAASPSAFWKQRSILTGLAVLLVLGLLSLFLFTQSRRKTRAVIAELQRQLQSAQAQESTAAVVPRKAENSSTPQAPAAPAVDRQKQLADIRESFRLPEAITTKAEVLTKQVAEEARKDPVALAQIIRSWLSESSHS
ncbi:MAG: flagellar basal-body MS-ring/collar protein FliF [Candidatus Sulfotelmatobacter sp.]